MDSRMMAESLVQSGTLLLLPLYKTSGTKAGLLMRRE